MRRLLPKSLFGQLVAGQIAVFLASTLLLYFVLQASLSSVADDFISARLRADAGTIEDVLQSSPEIHRSNLDDALGDFFLGTDASRSYLVRNEDNGKQIVGGRTGNRMIIPNLQPGESAFIHRLNADIFAERVQLNGRNFTIVIAQDSSRPEVIVDDVVASFMHKVVWFVPGILLLSTLASMAIIRHALAGMRNVAADADRIGPTTLELRLNAANLPDEAKSLVLATNRALDRVADGFGRQARFVSSVAHELRTPLALVALRSDALPQGEAKRALRKAVDQATHVVSQLMELATIENSPTRIGPLDLGVVARDAVEASAPLVFRSGRSIEAIDNEAAGGTVEGNEGLLRIALANLIDNAVRHTPTGTHIVVAAVGDAIFVSDNGPGILKEEEEHVGSGLHTRFRSAGQQRSDSAGLGLSIVQHVMAAMNGRMTVLDGTSGTSIRLQMKHQDVSSGEASHSQN